MPLQKSVPTVVSESEGRLHREGAYVPINSAVFIRQRSGVLLTVHINVFVKHPHCVGTSFR